MIDNEKLQKLNEIKTKLNKDYGKGTIMNLAEKTHTDVDAISSGSFGLDIALGIGGFPRGRMVEIIGWESSGKTTLAIETIVQEHKTKPDAMCLIIDAEHAFDRVYAEALGVDMSRLDIAQPDSGDEALEIADKLISSGCYSIVVIDSVAALVPKAELEGEMGESKMGLHARLMSQACRKLTGIINKTNTLVIWLNQFREKIGVIYGSPEIPSGGNALRFYASVRLTISRSTTKDNSVIKDDVIQGNLTKIKVIKNKVAPPFKTCEFDILYGEGIDTVGEVIKLSKEYDLLRLRAGIITFEETKYPYEEFVQMIKDNTEFEQSLITKIKNHLKNN